MVNRDAFAGLDVLVTGGVGFIGSNLVLKLVSMGANVTVVDAMIPAHGANLFNLDGVLDAINLNLSDLRDSNSLNHIVKNKKFIFNLAGQVSHTDSMSDPLFDLDINVRSHVCLLEACRYHNSAAKIVYASTRQIYGKPEYLPVDERHLFHPVDVNGINKYSSESFHMLYHTVYGLSTCILRLTNCYGPRQLIRHARQGFIGWFVRQLLLGEDVSIFGGGKQLRDFNYVDDVCDAFLLAACKDESTGKTYNLGGPPTSLLELVELMIAVHGAGTYHFVPFPLERKQIDIGDYYGDYGQIRKDLGWEPQVVLQGGLETMFSFYKKNLEKYV